MSFPSPFFIQNRNCYRAISAIRRGWPVMLSGSGVAECDGPESRVIGTADCAADVGDVVEIIWIGFGDVAIGGAQVGDEIRLGPSGGAVVGGSGRFIGIAGGSSVGAYTITRLGLLGYLPAGGGAPAGTIVPMRVLTDDAVGGVLTVPVDAWGQSLLWLPDTDAPIASVAFDGDYPIDAPIGTQLMVTLSVRAEDPAQLGYINVTDGDGVGGTVVDGPAQNRIYVSDGAASGLVVFTRVAEDVGTSMPEGWLMQVIPATPNDEAYADLESRITALESAL